MEGNDTKLYSVFNLTKEKMFNTCSFIFLGNLLFPYYIAPSQTPKGGGGGVHSR